MSVSKLAMKLMQGSRLQDEDIQLLEAVAKRYQALCRSDPHSADHFRRHVAWLLAEMTDDAPGDTQADQRVQLYTLRQREDDNARLARLLRDGPAQLLANAVVELAACLPLLDQDPSAVRSGLQALKDELQAGLATLRWILAELEPPALITELGLFESLAAYARRLGKHNGVQVDLHLPTDVPRLAPTMEVGIYHIVQEALRNAVQHGRAARIRLTALERDEEWFFEIQDDGVGFAPDALASAHGLLMMHEWATALGGDLQVSSAPERGTIVRLTVPKRGLSGSP